MADSKEDFAPAAWLELALVSNVPLSAKLAFLAHWDSPGAVLRQSVNSLKEVNPAAEQLTDQVPEATLTAVLEWTASSGGQCLFLGDDDYPSTITDRLHDAPLALFVRGDIQLLQQSVVAFLGAPQATEQGLERTRSFAHELAQENVVVAAGISPGIAQASHQGSLAAKGNPLGVIGDPRSWEGVSLTEELASAGLVVSELAPRTGRHKSGYAWRHRLLAALADVAVVIEAPANCDTLQLAATAGDLGCEVATIPADPASYQARGNNRLLREGAALVENTADVLALLGIANGV